jgi:hypothetical protein
MMDEDIDAYADLMSLICKLNGSLESAKEEYKVIATTAISSPNEKRLTRKQIELKAKFEEDLRQMVDTYGIILEIIMLEDDDFCKGTYLTENSHYQKLKSKGVNVIFMQTITSLEELDKRFKELFRSQLVGRFEFCYSPCPESNFYKAFPGEYFESHRYVVKKSFSLGCIPFGLVLHLEEFTNISWISDTWISVKSFKLGELKDPASKEKRQECFKKIAKKLLSSFSKEENDKLLIGIYNDVELHPYLSWRSPSCLVCSIGGLLKKCTLCKVAHYCGKDHQKDHWKIHKQHCDKLIALRHDNNNNNNGTVSQ